MSPGSLSVMGCDGARQASLVTCSSEGKQSRSSEGRDCKDTVTKNTALSTTQLFILFAFETLESWREQAKNFIVEQAQRIKGGACETDLYWQYVSITVYRGIAIFI